MRSEEEITKRDLTREEIAAMYVFNRDYALQSGGAIEFWQTLLPYRKRVVQQFLCLLDNARNPVQPREAGEPGESEAPHANEKR